MAEKPVEGAAATATEEEREATRKEIQSQRDRCAELIKGLIIAGEKRLGEQIIANDIKGAEVTSAALDRLRIIQDRILDAKIDAIDNSEEVAKLVEEFKVINKDLKKESDELKELAEDLKKAAKAIGVLEKILTKVATGSVG